MERMQHFSRGTLLRFAILALLVCEYPEISLVVDSIVQSDTKQEPQQTIHDAIGGFAAAGVAFGGLSMSHKFRPDDVVPPSFPSLDLGNALWRSLLLGAKSRAAASLSALNSSASLCRSSSCCQLLSAASFQA